VDVGENINKKLKTEKNAKKSKQKKCITKQGIEAASWGWLLILLFKMCLSRDFKKVTTFICFRIAEVPSLLFPLTVLGFLLLSVFRGVVKLIFMLKACI